MKNIFVIVSIFVSLNVFGANPVITVYHVSDTTCGKYLSDLSKGPEFNEVYSGWLAGFLSGVDSQKKRVTFTDKEANELWLKQYCEKNPLELYFNAAFKLSDNLDHR